jgi:hypothetical protein
MRQHSQLAPGVEITLRKFSRLLEFTLDIERNGNDSLFCKDGGKIVYVFDENIFELFANPRNFSRYVDLFHNNIWFEPGSFSDDLRQISAQSALITSEYLFSGELPGQAANTIFMTEWHFSELSHRRLEYSAQLREEIQALTQAPNSLLTLKSDAALDSSDVDELTRADLKLFASRTTDMSALERFSTARVTVRQMARSNYIFPLLQLKRIGSKEIASRIAPLAVRYRPSPEDRAEIRSDRSKFLDLMRRELRRREVEQERRADELGIERAGRSDGGLQNDADALAYIQWIARNKVGPRERIVLVTGDSLIFDVYRTWYLDRPSGEPFILRRVLQYAPIINLNDAVSDVVHHRELFQATREAIEAALFVFNLSGPNKSTDHLYTGREHLALALSPHRHLEENIAIAAFLKGLTSEWIQQRQSDFVRLIQLWQNMERFVIGIYSDQIVRRLSNPEWRQLRESMATGNHMAYVAYLKTLLDDLVAGSIRLFFPFAADFIRSATYRDNFDTNRLIRAPIALRLAIPFPQDSRVSSAAKVDDIHAMFDLWRQRDPATTKLLDVALNPMLAQRPDLVFAIAATLALEAGKWRDAERFSDLARSADPLISTPESEIQETRFESIYLYAISKRFRIGSLDPSSSGARANVWATLLEAAVDSLTQCELHHARMGEVRRHLRAISERAAVRLFYSCWGAIVPPQELKAREFDLDHAVKQFELSIVDLRKCLELELAARNVDPKDEQRIRFLARLERQYVTNLAAAQAITHLFASGPSKCKVGGLSADEIALVSDRIAQWDTNSVALNLPLVAQSDLLAFKALELKDHGAKARLKDCVKESRQVELALDKAIVRAFGNLVSD